MTLNPWRLRLLDVFARVGTVRAVAAEVLLSPSTVSQQLSALESEAGVPLFDRVGRTLTLTAPGLLLVERARELRDHMDAIEAELAEISTHPAGHVRVGGFASSMAPILIRAAVELARTHPRLTLELLEIEPKAATTALDQGRCDLIVTVDEADGTLLSPTITTVPLATDPLMVVAATGHPITERDHVALADLAHERWALDDPGTYLGELVPRHCRLAGFEPVVAGRFTSYGVLLSHVAAGLSVAVLPELAIEPRTGIVARPVIGLADRQIVAAVRTGSARRPAITTVIESLRHAARPGV
ncbi:LysR family transcriptional regulator [Cryobacterium soli]|uniref:LysR family transcriptional regulator n=1 Tax=Cryobacterium soli TaxID=2220095 RepID=UPI000E70C4CA|nr:LysR family transcriptional regulator [Cryobacterium soli]